MFADARAIKGYFLKLGLSAEIADIYLALLVYGAQTISELSRRSNVERTRIYRLMDELRASNLVEVEVKYKRSIFHAAPISNLEILLTKQEQNLRDLRNELDDMYRKITASQLGTPTTQVQAYQGEDGRKQMLWNQTKSKSENLSILHESVQTYTNEVFFDRWARACNDNGLRFRSVVGDNFVDMLTDWYSNHGNERLARWTGRYVSQGTFAINHSTIIYDDVVAYYNWKDGEVFGIEIHNEQIATAQRQFFEMLWAKSQDFNDSSIKELWQKNR